MAFRSPALRFGLGILGLTALAAVMAPTAQTQAPPSRLLALNIYKIKPEMQNAYIELQKSIVIPALQKSGQTWRDAWRTGVLREAYEFAYVSEIQGFERYDSPPPISKALGEAGYADYLAKVRPMIVSQNIYAIRTRPDLSYMADGVAQPKLAILTTVDVYANKLPDFETYIKTEWVPALKKGGGKSYAVSQVLYGGVGAQYLTLVGIDNYAELGKGHPVNRALGDDGLMKMMAKSGGFAQRIERRMVRLDPDLSFAVKGSADAR